MAGVDLQITFLVRYFALSLKKAPVSSNIIAFMTNIKLSFFWNHLVRKAPEVLKNSWFEK